MRIKIKKSNGDVLIIEDADLMIVEDRKGDPVSVACHYGPTGAFLVDCCTIDDEGRFNQVLRNLGIDRTVVKVPLADALRRPEDLSMLVPPP